MKIGLVNEYFPPFAPGGAEWSHLVLAKALAQRHELFVITPNYGAADHEQVDGMQIMRFPSPVKLPPGHLTVPQRTLTSVGFWWRMGRAVREAAVTHRLDIIHVQNKQSLIGAWWGMRGLSLPLVLTIRDVSLACPTGQCFIEVDARQTACGSFRYWWRVCYPLFLQRYIAPQDHRRVTPALLRQQLIVRIQRAILRRIDGVVGVSSGILDVYRHSGIRMGRQATTVYNIPPQPTAFSFEHLAALRQKYDVKENHHLVLYAGKLSPGKGSQVLADAAKLVFKSVKNVQFLFAGQGEINLPDSYAHHLGHVPHEELQALYHVADLVVIPSSWPEPFSRVGLEAMAAGKPLIGTAVGGTPEQIENGRNGLLVPRKDKQALAEAILQLLRNPAQSAQMGAAGLELINTKFNMQTSVTKLEAFYHNLIATSSENIPSDGKNLGQI